MFAFRTFCLFAGLSLMLAPAQTPGAAGKRIAATVDAAKTAAPVSPYLYGQFIEHIADTVNRSIWAELIDDRKFYYTVDSKTAAPPASRGRRANLWRPIGPDESVVMDKQNAYTGEHSPMVKLDGAAPRGVAQAGIMLRKGRAYSGRVVLAGDAGANVTVSLVWGAGADDRQTASIKGLRTAYGKFPLKFAAGAETDNGRLEIAGTGKGAFRVGAVSLMPADNNHGFRVDTTALLKAQRSAMYRWPGGNFLSAHEWRDAIGDIDKRPPRWDPVWNALQPNDVGTDEFMFMADLLGVDSFLSVNAGFGDAHSAAELVEYALGSAETPMGKLRAANGHPAPYKVKWWGIGNEMWGDFQFGYMALKQYVFKHNLFGVAMRKVDPTITLLATGNTPRMSEVLTDRDFSGGLLTNCLPYIDVMSEHFYAYEGGQRTSAAQPANPPPEESIIDAVHRAANSVRNKVEVYEEYYRRIPALKTKRVPIAIDEWAYSRLPANMKQTLGNALVFHEMFRHTDVIQMAGHTMATSVLDFNANEATLNATGLVFKLYRDHMGTVPVAVDGNSPPMAPTRPGPGGSAPRPNAGSPTWPLDVSAAWSADGKVLSIAVVNPTDAAQDLDLAIQGARLSGKGRMWRLTGPNLTAMTGLARKEVQVTEAPVNDVPKALRVPPISIDLYQFEKTP
jgi:alpha-L-arabinofuranosidase